MATAMKNTDKAKWVITIISMIALFLVPEGDFYTWNVKMFLVTTVGALFCLAFSLLDITLIGLLLPFSWLLFNVAPAAVVFAPWTNLALYMMLGSLILGEALNESGVLTRISYIIMIKLGSSYTKLLLAFFLVGVVISFLTFGGGYALMAALCASFCIALGIMGTNKAVVIGLTCMVSSVAAKAFLYCPGNYGVILASAQTILPDLNITFFQAVSSNWPMGLVALAIVFIVAKVYKDDNPLEGREYFQTKLAELGPWQRKEKMALAVLILLMALLLTTSFTGIDTMLLFCLVPLLMFMPGIDAASTNCLKRVHYGAVFFGGACIGIGAVSGYLGFGQLVSTYLVPLFQSSNPFFIFALFFAIIFVLNFLLTPVAIFGVMSLPLFTLCLQLGLDPQTFVYAFAHSAELILMPYEYLPYLVVYSFGMMNMSDFIKVNVIRCIVYFLGFMIVLIPYWHIIGLL